jgi:hypothetical protein
MNRTIRAIAILSTAFLLAGCASTGSAPRAGQTSGSAVGPPPARSAPYSARPSSPPPAASRSRSPGSLAPPDTVTAPSGPAARWERLPAALQDENGLPGYELQLKPPPTDASPAVPAETAWQTFVEHGGWVGDDPQLYLALVTNPSYGPTRAGGGIDPLYVDHLAWVILQTDVPMTAVEHRAAAPTPVPEPTGTVLGESLCFIDAQTGATMFTVQAPRVFMVGRGSAG